jgi:HAD superfamily hydrolase (TIGR01509 family)
MASMREVKVVAFDCDGVLFDTERSNRAYYNEILNHLGKTDMTPEQFAYVHSHTLNESLAHLFSDEKSLAEAYAYRKTLQYSKFYPLMEIEPGLVSLLKKLRPQRKTAIATNRTDTIYGLIEAFEIRGHFDFVVSSSDVRLPKPHPDALLKILEHFKIRPDQALYVGDSNVDQSAATSAGIRLVAYRNKALSSDYHIDSLKEIEALLELQP